MRENILEWLYPDAFDTRHTEITTGDWVFQLPGFQRWIKHEPNSNKLCAYGIRRHQLSVNDCYKLIDQRKYSGGRENIHKIRISNSIYTTTTQ